MAQPVVLLTGAQGFTGRYMRAALVAAGFSVHAWGTDVRGDVAEAVDMTDRTAVFAALDRLQPDYVVHLAAISFVAHGDAAAIYNVNILGTRNLLDGLARLERKPAKVLLASSANVYGETAGAISEGAPFHPRNDYAVSKVAMEYMARLWSTALPVVIVRPFNYTGVGQDENFLLPKIVAHFRRRDPVIELGNIDVWRDFNDVRNVVEIYVKLLEQAEAGEVYNVCTGVETSLREVISAMQSLSGHTIEVRTNPAFVRANEIAHLHGSNVRLRSLVGPLPPFDLRETLRWMYES
jgi:GDP-6-deoxy-D-talose 4-dehydrogenase